MEFMNVVRMQVKPDRWDEWSERTKEHTAKFLESDGCLGVNIIKTGETSICVIGRWASEDALAGARPAMIAMLDGTRDMLVPFSDELGVTDPVSGPVIHSG